MSSSEQTQLPEIGHIERLELYGTGEEPDSIIHNKAGSERILAVYYKLALDCGGVTPDAARQGLDLLGTLADEARAHPGSHPEIDLLHTIAEEERYLAARIVKKA